MDELKPCPFCGAENTDVGFIAHTDDCYLMRRYIGASSRKELGIAWNTRPIEDDLRTSISEAVKEIDNMQDFEPEDQIDTEWLHAVMRVLDILRRHGLVEDKNYD